MTIPTERLEVLGIVREIGTDQGGDLVMHLQPPRLPALPTPPPIPMQDPSPDPFPSIPGEIGTPPHPMIDDSMIPAEDPRDARSHAPAAKTREAAASSLAELSVCFFTRRTDP